MHPLLFVPGLLWPARILRDTLHDQALPTLSWLIGRAQSQSHRHGVLKWLAERCGLSEPLPIAPLRLLADAEMAQAVDPKPATHHWLCLDPVPVRVERRALVLLDPQNLALSDDEDRALRAELAALLAPFGELLAHRCGRWYLRCHEPLAEASPLSEAIDEPLPIPFPSPQASRAWRAALMEAQMLLAQHSFNQKRRASSQPAPALLWPWGGGVMPTRVDFPFAQLYSDDPLLRGLALAASRPIAPQPASFTPDRDWHEALIHLPGCAQAGRNALAWLAALHDLERAWLAPMRQALADGVLSGLTLLASGRQTMRQWTVLRRQRWHFWRRPASLAELADGSPV